jgi:hypothetical protein
MSVCICENDSIIKGKCTLCGKREFIFPNDLDILQQQFKEETNE